MVRQSQVSLGHPGRAQRFEDVQKQRFLCRSRFSEADPRNLAHPVNHGREVVFPNDPGPGFRLGQVYVGVSAPDECAERFSAEILAARVFTGGFIVPF